MGGGLLSYESVRRKRALKRARILLRGEEMTRIIPIVVGVGLLIVVFAVFGSFYTINEGERGVILRLGSVQGVAHPGLNFKMPFTDSVEVMTVRDQKRDFPPMSSYSKDVQEAQIEVSVIYRVSETSVDKVYARLGTDYFGRAIEPVVPQRLKEVFGQYQAQSVVADRTRLGVEVENAIRDTVAANSGGLVEIRSVQIKNIDFSDAYENAIESAAQAEAEVRKARNELDRQRVEADKVKVQAEARAEATRAQANAEADAIRARGLAEAEAVKAKGEALKATPELVTLIAAEKWNGVLPTTQVPGTSVPFIQLPQPSPTTGTTARTTAAPAQP
jgi:regulator of protease activity HflC (stomatin/prohibitin superfamily)